MLQLCTSVTAILPSRLQAVLYLLHWLQGSAQVAQPSAEVVKGRKEFLCTWLCPIWLYITHVKGFRRHLFKLLDHEQGLHKPRRPHGAWLEFIREAHVRATVCSRDVVYKPSNPQISADGAWIALSVQRKETPAPKLSPGSIMQLTRYRCISKKSLSSWRISHDHQVWLHEKLLRPVSVLKGQKKATVSYHTLNRVYTN